MSEPNMLAEQDGPSVIRWEDPPARIYGRRGPSTVPNRKWAPVVDELRQNPEKAAIIMEEPDNPKKAHSFARNIRNGMYGFTPRRAFSAVVRGGRVYAWYIGDLAAEQLQSD